jgi:hypothetical protein
MPTIEIIALLGIILALLVVIICLLAYIINTIK